MAVEIRDLHVIARSVSDEAIHSFFVAGWIASRSLSSGAHSRDPLARNDGGKYRRSTLSPTRHRLALAGPARACGMRVLPVRE